MKCLIESKKESNHDTTLSRKFRKKQNKNKRIYQKPTSRWSQNQREIQKLRKYKKLTRLNTTLLLKTISKQQSNQRRKRTLP